MRRSLLLLAALVPVAGLAGFAAIALPAVAESSDAACLSTPAMQPGPLDLSAIPAKPVTGPLSVQGVGDDDEDCGHVGNRHADDNDGDADHGGGHEARGDSDD